MASDVLVAPLNNTHQWKSESGVFIVAFQSLLFSLYSSLIKTSDPVSATIVTEKPRVAAFWRNAYIFEQCDSSYCSTVTT